MIVADVNLITYLSLPGDFTAMAEKVRAKDPDWLAPTLWRSEFRNILWKHMKHSGMTLADAQEALHLQALRFGDREANAPGDIVLRVAHELDISAYEAEYVALALTRDLTLVTADRRLTTRAPGVALSIEDFL